MNLQDIDPKWLIKKHQDKYKLIMNPEQLAQEYYKSKYDLSYLLKKEIKRDRFVSNSKGLQQSIDLMVANAIQGASKEMAALISADILTDVAANLNQIKQAADGTIIYGGRHSGNTSKSTALYNQFAKALGKGLYNGITGLFKEMLKEYDKED